MAGRLPNFLLLLSIIPSISTLTCYDRGIYECMSDYCIHVGAIRRTKDWYSAEELNDKCRQFGATWNLPKIDTTEKKNRLDEIIRTTGRARNGTWFYLGLERDRPKTNDMAWDWSDPAKWRWRDGTTLVESFG
jgi:hypothetical protein